MPDVVFLDIKMSDGSGFDLIDKIKREGPVTFQIIFTTAYNEFAIKAFKFSAIDYLLKPVDPDDLVQAVKKIRKSEPKDHLSENLNLLLENIKVCRLSVKELL